MRKSFKKAAVVGLTLVMALTTADLSSLAVHAGGLPTTDGHDKYVNKAVFDVISRDDFGTKPLEAPLFDKTKGDTAVTALQVPTLAYDDSSIGLVWQKPEKYDNIADYRVYINGKAAPDTARENFKVNAEWAAKYMEAFYNYYETASDVEMVNVDIHSYRATNLQPDTAYTFKVVALDKDGKELGASQTITQKTTKAPEILNVTDYGAKTCAADYKGLTDYDAETDAFVAANTKAIQAAIDACPEGGKVVIPEGIFLSGALWLKSNMTLEVNGTLWASPNSDFFEIGFLMYPFYTDTRGWGLVNAMSADESAPLENIRVTGTGTLYGNGWKYGSKDAIYGDGFTSNAGDSATKMAGDVDFTVAGNEKFKLPRWVSGNNQKVYWYGVQAADSARKYLSNVTNADGTRKYNDEKIASLAEDAKADGKVSGIDSDDLKNAYATRSSLLIMRNVTGVYVGDITIENPANHSVNILDSRNIAADNIKVFSFDGNNADGLGFGCSQDVICWNNFTDTGDDNLGFGASVGEGARDCDIQTNSEVWMFNNFLREGHGGLAAGSHTGNGIQDVLFEDTVMNHIDMAFRFKSAPTNGGFGANITMRDCAVADTQQGWVLTTSYSDPNSASSTEYADVGRFYNFASYNISVYGVDYNTVQVLADVDPVNNPQKPWHTHSNLYFQDITFGNVGKGNSGKYKNKNGWETLIGCENSVFYNFHTKSYASASVGKSTDKAWNNLQYCKNLIFQGTTLDVSASRADAQAAITTKLQNIMSGLTVGDPTVTAENYVEAVPDDPSGETEVAWTKQPSEAKDFFNDASKLDSTVKTPKYEAAKDSIGYLWDNAYNDGKTSYADQLIGFSYPGCDVTDLAKLSLSIERYGEKGTQTVSVRLDSKDGPEIAKTVIDGTVKVYEDYMMDVTLPQDVDTSKTHKLFVVFTSTSDVQKYIANVKGLTGYTGTSKVQYEPVSADLLNGGSGMTANTPVSAGMYGTVMSLENAAVKSDYTDETNSQKVSVTIDGKTYTDFVQADTAANAGGNIPDAGTATFVFSPAVDCSVTVHSKETGKTWWFVESPDGSEITNKATAAAITPSMTFNLKAGKTYYYYCQGSKPMVYGIHFNAPVDNADSLLKEETSTEGGTSQSGDAKQVKLSWTAVDNGAESAVYYGVETYIGNQLVDTVDGISSPETIISRLSAGVEYTFKVYVSEKGDNANSMSTTGWNKTYLGEARITTDGGKDTVAIKAPETVSAATSNAYYTHAQGTWTNISAADERVRGYKVYINGNLKKTIYNYEIKDYKGAANIVEQIGRLTPGMENQIEIVAFTDAGVEYKMNTTATTLKNYDYKAPVFAAGAKVTAAAQANGDVLVTWDAAMDDTAVGGYRVYVDGAPVLAEDGKAFNPVNGAKTTDQTTYTIKGLDLSKEHTITVQAGDTWWKAEQQMGTYDKMAGYNWTVKGLSTTVGGVVEKADYLAVDQAITRANKLTASDYVDFSGVTKAIAAVVRDLPKTEQAKVDAMAKAINDAIDDLKLKPVEKADYSAVDQAIARANKLTASDYVDFSGVTKAVAAVVKDLPKTEQAKVDAMAKAINDAIDALVKKPAPEVNVDTEIGLNAPETELTGNTEEIIGKILTDAEKALVEAGQSVKITVSVSDLTDLVSSADQAAIAKVLGDFSVGQYLDITVSKKIGDQAVTAVTETSGKLMLTLTIPEALRNTDASVNRTYQVVRVHDGVATLLGGVYDEAKGTLTIESDQFSTYAVIYKDTAVINGGEDPTPGGDVTEPGGNQTPQTGDTSMMFFFMALLALSGGVVVFEKKRRRLVQR